MSWERGGFRDLVTRDPRTCPRPPSTTLFPPLCGREGPLWPLALSLAMIHTAHGRSLLLLAALFSSLPLSARSSRCLSTDPARGHSLRLHLFSPFTLFASLAAHTVKGLHVTPVYASLPRSLGTRSAPTHRPLTPPGLTHAACGYSSRPRPLLTRRLLCQADLRACVRALARARVRVRVRVFVCACVRVR